jgi:integrase
VTLPAFAVEALREHRARMLTEGHAPHKEALVFCDTAGGPIRKSNLTRRSFHPLLRRAGLVRVVERAHHGGQVTRVERPLVRFHDLRHTHATLLLARGVHPRVVQERLGHANIAITLGVYSHVLPTMQRAAATELDAMLQSVPPAAASPETTTANVQPT